MSDVNTDGPKLPAFMAAPAGFVALALAYTGFTIGFQAFKAGDHLEFGLYAVFCMVCMFALAVIIGMYKGGLE